MPDSLADARGHRPRKTSRSQATYQGTDACGIAPRMNPRSALPGVDADACGIAPRMNPRSALPGDADACGIAPRMTPRSALPGVDADACGIAPRKTSRPVGRGRRPRGRRPNRRRSLNHVRPSLPRLSPDSTGIDGEIALLRSLTNRLLSTRPLDYTQINRCLRLIIRAYSAQAKAPKQLTDQEQIDNLIKKVFQDNVKNGDLNFRDLVPVRMARPGDKWWPWREVLPLNTRWHYGLIDPDEPWPHEENKGLAEEEAMNKLIADAYLNPNFFKNLGASDDPDDDDPPPYDENPPNLTVIPAPEPAVSAPERESIPGGGAGVPLVGALPGGGAARAEPVEVRAGGGAHPAHPSSHDEDPPNPPPRIARGRPPP